MLQGRDVTKSCVSPDFTGFKRAYHYSVAQINCSGKQIKTWSNCEGRVQLSQKASWTNNILSLLNFYSAKSLAKMVEVEEKHL